MQLWWRIRGWARMRLISADCVSRLRRISREIRLVNVDFHSDLEVEFDILRTDVEKLTVHDGETLELVQTGGMPVILNKLRHWRLLTGVVLLLITLTAFLPTRILFLQVRGNSSVPAGLILERAAECGVYFGASSRELRSEQVKNHLLWAIPELRWAGVNTVGCTAVITVAERQSGEVSAQELPGDVVAVTDALVTEIYPQAGTARTAPGEAVRRGQVLISGATDLGASTRVERAAGEVYGLTSRSVDAVLPAQILLRRDSDRVVRKYSLRIGKKYVNFSNDSGILHGTCVKMRTVNYLTLPGGFQLPVALVTDTYQMCQTEAVSREMDPAELTEQARHYVREQMRSGIILDERVALSGEVLTAVFECREMIGAFRPGINTEGDTNERENRERGAG